SAFITGHPPKLSALFTAMALALGGTPPEILPSEQGNAATGPDRHERIHEKWRKTV
ncbi:MAG: hypothetical protein FJZ00_10335, partial [Candidatus Sericytochromatia bacterium]|nr:hypothetical protein [Candidatus Tanganyikabacteria bacterium]